MSYLDKTFKIVESLIADKNESITVFFNQYGSATIKIVFYNFTIYIKVHDDNVTFDIDGKGNALDVMKLSIFYYYIKSIIDKALKGV